MRPARAVSKDPLHPACYCYALPTVESMARGHGDHGAQRRRDVSVLCALGGGGPERRSERVRNKLPDVPRVYRHTRPAFGSTLAVRLRTFVDRRLERRIRPVIYRAPSQDLSTPIHDTVCVTTLPPIVTRQNPADLYLSAGLCLIQWAIDELNLGPHAFQDPVSAHELCANVHLTRTGRTSCSVSRRKQRMLCTSAIILRAQMDTSDAQRNTRAPTAEAQRRWAELLRPIGGSAC